MGKEKIKDNLEEVEAQIVDDDISQDTNSNDLNLKDTELMETNNRLLRLQADFSNFRKRTEKEKLSYYSNGVENFVCELLPILDNFQRALEFEKEKEDGFYQGVKMIEEQIIGLLKHNSIEEIKSIGETFDPNFHEAVVTEESEEYGAGIVLAVLQKGYMMKDKVLRPAMVMVSK